MTRAPHTPDGGEAGRDDSVLAAEYALNLLGDDEARAFEARLDTDGALRSLLAGWHEEFVGLTDDIEAVPPPGRVRAALARRVTPAAAPRPRRLGRGLGFLGGLTSGLALAAVAALVVFLVLPQVEAPGVGPTRQSGPTLQAEIAADDRSLVVEARYAGGEGVLSVDRQQGGPPPGRVLELWLIPEGADAPISLGVLPESESARIEVPENLRASLGGGVLAISDEPPGGSPTGAPTGSVLAAGPVNEA